MSPYLPLSPAFSQRPHVARLRKILDSVNWESNTLGEKLVAASWGGDLNSKEIVLKFKKLRTALKDQFAKTEESFRDVPLDGTVFDEFDKLKEFNRATLKAVDNALFESEKFLEENSVQTLGNDTPPAGTTSSASRRVPRLFLFSM